MQLLGTSPEVAFDRVYPYENSYLTYFTRLVGEIAAPRPEGNQMIEFLYGENSRVGPFPFQPENLDCGAVARDSLRGVWQAFSSSMNAGPTSNYRFYAEKFWGDLTPIIDAGLDPVVIDLVRDPRDLIASVRAFNVKSGRQSFGRAQASDDHEHLRRLVVGMSFRLKEFAEPLPVTRIVIRYEDLVSDLAAQVVRLENTLGIALDVAPAAAPQPEMALHMTSPSAADSVGRWRHDLSPDEVQAIEKRLGEPMGRLGYTVSTAEA